MADPFPVEGEVDFSNLVPLLEAGEAYVEQADDPVFDLQGVSNSSSAVVALMIGWYRRAFHRQKSILFAHVPEGVMKIIEVAYLDELLPIAD